MKLLELITTALSREQERILIFDDATAANVFHDKKQPTPTELTTSDLEDIAYALTNNPNADRLSNRTQIGNATIYRAQFVYERGQLNRVTAEPAEVYIVSQDEPTKKGRLVQRISRGNQPHANHAQFSDSLRNHGYTRAQVDVIHRIYFGEFAEAANPKQKPNFDWKKRVAIYAGAATLAAALLYAVLYRAPDIQDKFNEAATTPDTNLYRALNPNNK